LFAHLFGFLFINGSDRAKHVCDALHLMQADVFCLEIGPLIAGLGLQQ
jgi:hypothetical protein